MSGFNQYDNLRKRKNDRCKDWKGKDKTVIHNDIIVNVENSKDKILK